MNVFTVSFFGHRDFSEHYNLDEFELSGLKFICNDFNDFPDLANGLNVTEAIPTRDGDIRISVFSYETVC